MQTKDKIKTPLDQVIAKYGISLFDMRNKERKLAFIEETQGGLEDVYVANILRKFNQFGKIENKFNKDFFEFTRNDFVKFFESFTWGYNAFCANKSYIKAYLDWGYSKKLVDSNVSRELQNISFDIPSHRKLFETYYFRSYQELKEEVDIFREKITKNNQLVKFRIAEIAIYLAWAGIKIKDACEIKQQDVDEYRNLIFVKSLGQYITIETEIMNHIKDYLHSEQYIVTDRLMRTPTNPTMTVAYLSNFISRFFGDNDINTDKEKVISYNKVYWSGIYSRARINEKECGQFENLDMQRLSEVFKEDYMNIANAQPTISKRLTEYNDYLSYLFGKEYYSV